MNALRISFAVLALLTVMGWYVWSVRRQLGILAGNIAIGIERESWVPLFGRFFGILYAQTPLLTVVVLAMSVWLFGWRVGALVAVGLPVSRWVLRPIAKEHARHMLLAIERMTEKEERDGHQDDLTPARISAQEAHLAAIKQASKELKHLPRGPTKTAQVMARADEIMRLQGWTPTS